MTAEVADLTDRLETRKLLDRAKGRLQTEHGMTEPDAFRWIQKTSMDRRSTMRAVAEAVLAGETRDCQAAGLNLECDASQRYPRTARSPAPLVPSHLPRRGRCLLGAGLGDKVSQRPDGVVNATRCRAIALSRQIVRYSPA